MCAWSQLTFSAIPVSISTVSLTGRQEKIANNSKCTGREKTSEKRNIKLLYLVFVPSVFGEKFPTAEF
jgi:hypothetical protein